MEIVRLLQLSITRWFREVRRVLKADGTLWLNLGDSYTSGGRSSRDHDLKLAARHMTTRANNPPGLKPKDLVGIPWRVAFALQSDGWFLRQDIIWHKPNPMPESVTDRCTKAHEYIFLLSKLPKYYYDASSILEPFVETRVGRTGARGATPLTAMRGDRNNSGGFSRSRDGRNKRSVWTVNTIAFRGAHFATFPPKLIEPCILAGSKPGDTVLDPFFGAGTTGLVASQHRRKYLGIELNPEYAAMAAERIGDFF